MTSSSIPNIERKLAHSCIHCSRLIIRPPPQPGPHGFRCRLPDTKREALQAAKDGCPIYRLLIRGYRFASVPEEARMLARAVLGKPDWRLPRAGVFGEQERIIYFAESLSQYPFQIRFDDSSKALFLCLAWGSHWFNATAKPHDPTASVFPVRPINRNVASAESFQLARTWLDECVNHGPNTHRLCPSARDIKFTPRRLLEVQSVSQCCHIRLHETSPGEQLQYACLSYCWGGDQPVKTIKATLASRKQSINLFSLPKTLQDSVFVTQELGLSHIWIDCLCIVQDDNEDLARELPQMPDIYKNAYVTISASSASTCYEGFLQRRKPSASAECEDITLRYQCPDGAIGDIYLFQDEPSSSSDPIDKRAWTLQERWMSPRFLDFAGHQLRWKCNSRAHFDGGYAPVDYEDRKESSASTAKKHSDDEMTLKHTIYKTWADIIENYTQRSLSFSGDKLVAIAALASEVGKSLNSSYLAGLWKEHLPTQLLWRLWGEPVERPAGYRAPTWSWASVDGWVMPERDVHADRIAIEVLETTTELVTPGFEYGAVKSGSLVVKGRLLTAYWFINRESALAIEGFDNKSSDPETDSDDMLLDEEMADSSSGSISTQSWETTSDVVDARFLPLVDVTADAVESDHKMGDPDFAIEVRCLQIVSQSQTDGASGLLLVPASPDGATPYKRIGYFFFDNRKDDVFLGAEEEIVTIV